MVAPSHRSCAMIARRFVRYISSTEIPALLDAYAWSSIGGGSGTVVDIGGGYGEAMSALSRRHPSLHCINLDLEVVIRDAPARDGVTHVAGDMFDASTLPPCDVLLMKHVLADWADGDAAKALKACGTALRGASARLLVADVVLPVGADANGSGDVNLNVDALLMLVGNRGERTETRWRRLAATAGFEVESIIDTASPSINLLVLAPSTGGRGAL